MWSQTEHPFEIDEVNVDPYISNKGLWPDILTVIKLHCNLSVLFKKINKLMLL